MTKSGACSSPRHHKGWVALRLLSVAAVVTGLAMSGWVAGPAGLAASADPSASSASSLTDVACPTAMVCEAAGTNSTNTIGILFGSTDGGLHWQRQGLPGAARVISALACPSATTCEAVVLTKSLSVAIRTTNGGHSWVSQQLPPGGSIDAISCPTVSVCEAVGDSGALRTTNGGRSWTPQHVPAVAYSLAGIACPQVTVCEALGWTSGASPLGIVIGTSNGGATWRSQHIPTKQQPAAISCPSPVTCEIALSAPFFGGPASAQALRTTDGGSTWVQQDIVDGVIASGISCPALRTCEAVGATISSYVAVRTTNGGSTWDLEALPRPSVGKTLEAQDIACSGINSCVLVGSLVSGRSSVGVTARTIDGGKTWSVIPP